MENEVILETCEIDKLCFMTIKLYTDKIKLYLDSTHSKRRCSN